MNRNTNILKQLIFVVLLGSYSSVYMISFACNVQEEVQSALLGLTTEAVEGHHDHGDGSHSHHSHDHNKVDQDEDSSKDDDGCCDDTAPVYVASLSNTVVHSIGWKIDLPETVLRTNLICVPAVESPILAAKDYLNKAPPLIRADLRLLFDSFII
ncbi:MAG: hypothetical protein COB85_01685 [Bacteroidetes bacterium]|nr:MAG: hypothetical protein COB85_01685 [Bacteroidota bacterium]